MADTALSTRFQYTELLVDSAYAALSGYSGISAKNWPLISFENRNFRPAGIKVISAELPFVFDTLLAGFNSFIVNDTRVYITPGTYDITEMLTELNTKLVDFNITVLWSDFNQKFTFYGTSAYTIRFDNVKLGSDTNTVKTAIYKFLGFDKAFYDVATPTDGDYVITSPNVALPSGPYYLYLNSEKIGQEVKALVQDINGTNLSSTQICRIPLNVQRGSLLTYTDPDSSLFFDFVPGFLLQNFDLYFTIEDDRGFTVVDFK